MLYTLSFRTVIAMKCIQKCLKVLAILYTYVAFSSREEWNAHGTDRKKRAICGGAHYFHLEYFGCFKTGA